MEAEAAAASRTIPTYPLLRPFTQINSSRSDEKTRLILIIVLSIAGGIFLCFVLWRFWVWLRERRDNSAREMEEREYLKSDRPYAIIAAEQEAQRRKEAEAEEMGRKWWMLWKRPTKVQKEGSAFGKPIASVGLLAGGIAGE